MVEAASQTASESRLKPRLLSHGTVECHDLDESSRGWRDQDRGRDRQERWETDARKS